jgi:hypothetical protein
MSPRSFQREKHDRLDQMITFRLTAAQAAELDQLAAALDLERADLIRLALDQFMALDKGRPGSAHPGQQQM